MTNVRKCYLDELQDIRELINQMGSQTKLFVAEAVKALVVLDSRRAESVRHYERKIDALHREIEEKCIAVIATQQPVASDLRFLIASIKISTEIERIADYANNITKITYKKLSGLDITPVSHLSSVIDEMGSLAINMLVDTLNSYESARHEFVAVAKERDKAVNKVNAQLFKLLIDTGKQNGTIAQALLELYAAIRYLERLADRTVNIAEWVFYMKTGYRYG